MAAPLNGQTPHQLRMQAEEEASRLRQQLERATQPHPLAQQALEVLEALAEIAAASKPSQRLLTITSGWGFGSATIIAPDGFYTHVGGDTGETREENLTLFVQGMHQLLVQCRGGSWMAPTTAPPEVQSDV